MAPAFTREKMQLAARIKAARIAIPKMSQRKAAALVGTSRRHWIRWENGETAPNPAYLNRIADVLGDDSLRPPDDDEDDLSSPAEPRDSLLDLLMDELVERVQTRMEVKKA